MENQLDESTRSDETLRNGDLSDTGEREQDEEQEENDDEEETTEKLEEEVKEMAKKLKKYRSTLPDQLKSTLSSVLASQRPPVPSFLSIGPHSLPEPGPSGNPPQAAESSSGNSHGVFPAEDDESKADGVELLRDKISSNISAMPILLKRMNEIIPKIDKLACSNEAIHPAFKRKKS